LTRRCLILTGALWLCFLTKLLFYSSFVPLWEGYDEFAHFAFVQYLTANHKLPPLKNTGVSQEVAESLRLAPVPWTIRQWTPGWIPYDDFRHLPEASRRQRERELKQIPRTSAREQAPNLPLYEAQQPPLAYLLYSIPYAAFRNANLPTRAWILRIAGSAIVSLVIPLGFIVSRRILGSDLQAVGVAAVIAAMPELMMLAGHGGNEPLAIVLGTACIYGLILMVEKSSPWRALLLGSLLGCALLTKSYFLTLIPVVLIVVLIVYATLRRRRVAAQLLITLATTVAIAGWWYGRAIYTTGTLTGDQISIAARQSATPILRAIRGFNWRGAADFALTSHIWLGGWSFLVLRTWMYRAIELILIVGQVANLANLRRVGNPPFAICIAAQFFFWAGMAYFAFETYLATGESAVLGYFACALVVPEAVCVTAGIAALVPGAWKRFVAPGLVVCFAATEVYGTVFCLMPYYAGFTAHSPRGSVPAMHAGQLLHGGRAALFRNLAVNKPDILTAGVLLTLFTCFLLAVVGVVAVSVLTASFRESGKSGPGAANGLVPLRSG
jgi:hypothetical protein